MQRIYSGSDPMLAGHLREVLEQHHIPCLLKNAYLSGAAGELPPIEAWPELWVEAEDAARAREILAGQLQCAPQPDWKCPCCGERVEGQFGQCWSCGALPPA